MTTAFAFIAFLVLFITWSVAVMLIAWHENKRTHSTGLTQLVIAMTLWGGAMMYFGLAALRSWTNE